MKPTEPIEMAKKTTKKPKEQMTRYQVASNWGKIECALSQAGKAAYSQDIKAVLSSLNTVHELLTTIVENEDKK